MPEINMDEESVQRFFAYARERHAIYLRRRSGRPRPWTDEPVMSRYRITNVYRELDKTTAWFREHVRDPLRDLPEVLLATVLFRWFNTIRSGETVFQQLLLPTGAAEAAGDAGSGATPWEVYLRTGDPEALRGPLRRQGAPWVTGAYMIRSPEGMDKLDGILHSVHQFRTAKAPDGREDWRRVAELCLERRETGNPVTLKFVWEWLKKFYGMGPFLAYEVVTDLRWTALLDRAPDIMTWANPGPGALRGANIILRGASRGRKGRLVKASYEEAHAVMRALLELSRSEDYWPQSPDGVILHTGIQYDQDPEPGVVGNIRDVLDGSTPADWPAWDMREPEMFLCEFAKLERTRLGYGRPRGSYP